MFFGRKCRNKKCYSSKIPNLTENRLSNKTDLIEKQIKFLKGECQNKNLIATKHFIGTTFSQNYFQNTRHW